MEGVFTFLSAMRISLGHFITTFSAQLCVNNVSSSEVHRM